jgi:hypothetical protein
LTEAERAFLAAGHAYCTARREAFDRAQQGTPQDARRRAALVDERSRDVLKTMMLLELRSARDVGA